MGYQHSRRVCKDFPPCYMKPGTSLYSLIFRIFLDLGIEGTANPPPLKMVDVNLGNITFVEFVIGQHLDLFVEACGKEEIAKGAVEVLTRIQNTGTEHGPWLEALGQASGWQQDAARLLQAIAAYEMCCDKIMKIPEGAFEDAVDWVQDV